MLEENGRCAGVALVCEHLANEWSGVLRRVGGVVRALKLPSQDEAQLLGEQGGVLDRLEVARQGQPVECAYVDVREVDVGRQPHRAFPGLQAVGKQAVAHHQGDFRVGAKGFLDDGLIGLVKAAAPVGAGQVFVLVLSQGLDRDKAVFFHKGVVHVGKHRVLRRRVVGPHAQHGYSLIAGARPPQAQPGRGAQL